MEKKDKKKFSPLWIIIPIGLILLGFLFYVPFWINNAYLKGNGFETVWNGAEFLAFYGAALSAVGALFLGGITIWQNNRLRKQNEQLMRLNEKAQKRLERINKKANTISYNGNKLTLKANELNTINKIIEIENTRIKNIMNASDAFLKACKPTHIVVSLANYKDLQIGFTQMEETCDFSFMALSRELRTDIVAKEANSPFFQSAANLYYMAKKVFDRYKEIKVLDDETLISLLKQLGEANNEFLTKNEKYIQSMQDKLSKVLYDNLSLDEVRALYRFPIKEEQNGQDEDGE